MSLLSSSVRIGFQTRYVLKTFLFVPASKMEDLKSSFVFCGVRPWYTVRFPLAIFISTILAWTETGTSLFILIAATFCSSTFVSDHRGPIIVWRFGGLSQFWVPVHSHLSAGLRLRNYRAVAGNHKFSSRFSVFTCFCGGYSNRVKWLRRLSGNFILLKVSLL